MKENEVTMVRVYSDESSHLLKEIMHYLQNDVKISGASVFRAISGFGTSGEIGASLLDLSLNLPLVIEFFDKDHQKMEKVIEHLKSILKANHIVYWKAKVG